MRNRNNISVDVTLYLRMAKNTVETMDTGRQIIKFE